MSNRLATRRNLIIAVVALVVVIAGILIARDWILPTFSNPSVTGVPTQANSAIDQLKTNQAKNKAGSASATATPTPAGAMNLNGSNQLVSYTIPNGGLNSPFDTVKYTSCTADRGATPTATPSAQTSTAEPTPAATSAANAAATASASDNLVFLRVDPKQSEACYEVAEVLFDEANGRFNVAVGVTTDIDGEVAVNMTNVAASSIGDFTINISEFKSDQPRRDGIIRQRWLESNKYPFAKLTNVTVSGLPSGPYKDGETLNFQINGTLTAHDKPRQTTFTATATLTNNELYVHAYADMLMTDFGFDPPDIAGIVKAGNNLRLVLNLVAEPETTATPAA